MSHEQLQSSQCPCPMIQKEVIVRETPIKGQKPVVVALGLRCDYVDKDICRISNRIKGEGENEEEATLAAMQAVDREVLRGCQLFKPFEGF